MTLIKTMPWGFPDKPIEVSVDFLKDLDKHESGEWIATFKHDGYRAVLDVRDKGFEILSPKTSKHPISDYLRERLKKFVSDNKFKNGTRVDMEWMARREANINLLDHELLATIGIMYLNGKRMASKKEEERWAFTQKLKYNEGVIPIESSDKNYVEFFEKSKSSMLYEGIVLKKKNSKMKLKLASAEDNSLWLKCKWRGGDSGLTTLEQG